MTVRKYLFFFLLLVFSVSSAQAERSIRVLGRTESTVSTPKIHLGDVATIASDKQSDDEAIIALKKLVIDEAPRPGKDATLSANRILERMHEEGVRTADLGYRFPRIMKVARAGRKVTEHELLAVIEDVLRRSEGDIQLQSVSVPEVFIAPGLVQYRAVSAGSRRAGILSYRVVARVPGEEPVRFQVNASVDQWLEVPVAARGIRQGESIQPNDLMMGRFHIKELPSDIATSADEIVGFATRQTISHGDVFQRKRLEIPPVIKSGDRVVLQFRSRLIEATATGTALEDGVSDQMIRVRNVASNKIVLGTVIEPGLVRVSHE